MAADDKSKSKRKELNYPYKGYVVGDYKNLLESLRAEDGKDSLGKEKPPVETEKPLIEAEKPAFVEKEEALVETNELAAVVALVIEKEKPSTKAEETPVEAKKPPTAAEEIPVVAEEPPTKAEETPVAKASPPQKSPSPAAKDVSLRKDYTAPRRESALSAEEAFSPGNSFRKDALFFNLIMIFLLAAITTVLLYSPNMGSFSMFLLISCMIFNMIASYNLGLQKGLIVAVILTFAYGSYILYETMITRTITEINFAYIAWLFFFPLGSLLSGQLSNSVSAYRWALENKKSLEKFVTIDASTGFYNKQGFFMKMDEEFTRAKRYKTDFSVLLINIANFNELRIIYGEINSVSILKTVADIITTQVRFSDIKSLIEENMLGVILTETNEDGAKIVIEKMHIALDRVTTDINSMKKVIRIKPNIGIASMREGDADSLEIYERAREEINYDRG